MPLTPRFEELVEELNLPDAAWHLSRTNAGTANNASESELLEGKARVLKLLNNTDQYVSNILAEIESELDQIEPMEMLLLQKPQWTPYDGDIARRLNLEKVRRNAKVILDWWLTAEEISTIPSPQNLFTIRKKKDEEKKIENLDEVVLAELELNDKQEVVSLEIAA